ncbi:hypothetical protein GJ496_008782 [Pomphorhynchus laevis]|nr:hypothetical protein GJ496_008782 [Pomphorhynchus laevis]
MIRKSKSLNIKGNLKGDGLQKGGTIVVDTDGTLLYNFTQADVTDELNIDDMLNTLKIERSVKTEIQADAK